jgi:hypothetical protein
MVGDHGRRVLEIKGVIIRHEYSAKSGDGSSWYV